MLRAAALSSFAAVTVASLAAPSRSTIDDRFTTSEQCAQCHAAAPGASAMQSRTGDDVSPFGLWQGTMMANAFRDPYFRAQLARESAQVGDDVQRTCVRCHAPMAWHSLVLAGDPPPKLADVADDPAADDGVSCTVCHLIDGKNLGTEASFSGHPSFDAQRRIYGPFADVATRPMQNLVRYTPTQGMHVRSSALCGSCHTLFTSHAGGTFPEQTPFLEWRNSDFSDERGAGDGTRTCQQCHMPATGSTRIARTPMGMDFEIPVRDGYAAHAFVGGNALMLDLLREHREELAVLAEPDALARMANATRRQLAESTARLAISAITAQGGTASFTVRVDNLTGHKFPTGYPARRAFLHVQVRRGREVVFESGAYDERGRLTGVADELAVPHVEHVTSERDVVVYEMVAADGAGKATTSLTAMAKKVKDNRLLPSGWRADGPHADVTAPVGIGSDADFVGGSDTIAFAVPVGAGRGRLTVHAELRYQPVPPAWVDGLRGIDAEACRRFVAMYDTADVRPEAVASATRVE